MKIKYLLFILVIAWNSVISNNSKETTHQIVDTLRSIDTIKSKPRLTALYLGYGGGVGYKGEVIGAYGSFVLSNNLGGSISYQLNAYDAEELPSDYVSAYTIGIDGENSSNTPQDLVQSLSFKILKRFPTDNRKVWTAVEVGPSYISHLHNTFTPNPNASSSWLGYESNYITKTTQTSSVGLSLGGKVEFLIKRYFGFEMGVTSNLNEFHSFIGIEFCLKFGLLRDRLPPLPAQ